MQFHDGCYSGIATKAPQWRRVGTVLPYNLQFYYSTENGTKSVQIVNVHWEKPPACSARLENLTLYQLQLHLENCSVIVNIGIKLQIDDTIILFDTPEGFNQTYTFVKNTTSNSEFEVVTTADISTIVSGKIASVMLGEEV